MGPLTGTQFEMAQRISSPLFVGRSAELTAFDRLVDKTARGAGSALVVAGEAGIGKSRFVAEIEERLRATNTLVLIGECVEVGEGELAFSPIVAALRPVMGSRTVQNLEEPLRRALAGLWPVLGETGETSREQLFEAVYRVLAELSRQRLVVLIIEDLHWIDCSSRDLLAFLVRNGRRDRLLVVGTYRPDELHRGHPLRPFLAEFERSGQAQRLELRPLGQSELADQLFAIAGVRPSATTIQEIFARSEGNPFFAEELLASADTGPTDDLPGSLREALLLRIERLSPVTQDVLRAAAVVGRSVDHRLLGYLAPVDEADLLAALREATEHHVLVLTGRGMAYTFRHALLREAIYDDTFPGERLRLHRVIAEALAAHPEFATAGPAAELAYHWHAAGELPAALRASLQAAAEAEGMHAYDEAFRHLDRTLELWARVPEADQIAGMGEIEVLLQASETAEVAGHAERALALGQRAREAVDDRLVPLLAAAAENRIGRALWVSARADEAIEHLAEARRLVPADPPSVQRAEALAWEGRALMLSARSSEAQALLEEALELATQLSVPHVQASVLNTLAITYGRFGEAERAIASGRRGREIATQAGLAYEIGRGYVNGSQAMDDAGQVSEALALGLEGIEVVRRLGLRHGEDQLRVQAGWRLARMGRLAEAERVIAPSLEGAATPFGISASKSIAGYLALQRADFNRAERLLQEAWELMQRSGGFQLIGPALAWMASLHLWRGELEKAEQRVWDGLGRMAEAEPELMYNAELYWLGVRILAERVNRGLDQRDAAASRARSVLAAFDEAIAGIPGDGAPPEPLAFRGLAEAELTRLLDERDAGPWRVAGERFRRLKAEHRVAYTQFRAAEAMALGGAHTEQVEDLLRQAHAIAVSLGTLPFQGEVEGFAATHGISLASPVQPQARTEVRFDAPAEDVLELLTGSRSGPNSGRMLATIMFTDIVGSTSLAADLGDERWRELLDRHDDLVRDHLHRFGGVAIKFIGDGTLSTFQGPGRAIECARALREAVKTLDIQVRAGVHTGEIELRGQDIGGIAVHIAARVAARAGPSEILVSKTVTDVVAGSGIRFEARGTHDLKGVPGRWQLSAVAQDGEGLSLHPDLRYGSPEERDRSDE